MPGMAVDSEGAANDFRATLPELHKQFINAYNSRDLVTVVDFYAEDSYVVRPNKEIVRGRQAIRDYHAGRMQSGQRFISMTTVGLVVDATAAIEIAHAVIELSGLRQSSRLVAIWKRHAGEDWRIDADIFV
jgi:ketosteroid isomerase-like protein